MVLENAYSILFFIFTLLLLYKLKVFHLEGLPKRSVFYAYLVKSLVSCAFYYYYSYYYGLGYLNFDSGDFIRDGKILNEVFYKNSVDYFKLLSGFGENSNLIETYLSKAFKWSMPYSVVLEDSKNIVRLNSIIHFFSKNQFAVHFMVFNMFSLFGICQIYLYFKKFILLNSTVFFAFLLCLPTMLFFTSGVLKEPMLLFSIGFMFYAFRRFQKRNWTSYLRLILALFFLLSFKVYVFLIMIPGLLFYFVWMWYFRAKNRVLVVSLLISFFALTFFLFIRNQEKIITYLSYKQFDFNNISKGGLYFRLPNDPYAYCIQTEDYENIKIYKNEFKIVHKTPVYRFNASTKDNLEKVYFNPIDTNLLMSSIWVRSGSYIETDLIFNSYKRLIKITPITFVNAVFRPMWFDGGGKLKYLNSIETIVLMLLLFISIVKRRKLTIQQQGIIFSLLIFSLILSLIIGWTTPLFGAIVRYRIPVYLALLLIACILLKPHEKWKNKTTSL